MRALGKTYYRRDPAKVFRDAEMVLLYRKGKTLAQIGRKYGVTRERVRQLLARFGLSAEDGGCAIRTFLKTRDSAKSGAAQQAAREALHFARWGMPREAVNALSPFKRSDSRHPTYKFRSQKSNAAKRGIEWRMTFAEWWRVWQESGKWEQRGRGEGYCMARWADDGPYSVENVYICTIGQNFSDSYITKPASLRQEARRRNSGIPTNPDTASKPDAVGIV